MAAPTIQIFTKDVEKELDTVTCDFLQDQIQIDFKKKEVVLPRIFQDRSKDFGKDSPTILKWVSSFLSKEERGQILTLSNSRKLSIKYISAENDIFLSIVHSLHSRPFSLDKSEHSFLDLRRETKQRLTLF